MSTDVAKAIRKHMARDRMETQSPFADMDAKQVEITGSVTLFNYLLPGKYIETLTGGVTWVIQQHLNKRNIVCTEKPLLLDADLRYLEVLLWRMGICSHNVFCLDEHST